MTAPQITDQIKILLQQQRRGMTLADIGGSLDVHRNSVSKYMGMLQARGA